MTVTAESILRSEHFTKVETFVALKGIAEANETPLHQVIDAYSNRNESVVASVEAHLKSAAETFARAMNAS